MLALVMVRAVWLDLWASWKRWLYCLITHLLAVIPSWLKVAVSGVSVMFLGSAHTHASQVWAILSLNPALLKV